MLSEEMLYSMETSGEHESDGDGKRFRYVLPGEWVQRLV